MIIKFASALSLSLLLHFQPTYAKEMSTIEHQISDYILKQSPEQLSLLKQLVNINSGTTNIAGIHQVGDILRSQFDKLGFKTYWVEEPSSMNRAGTLIATRTGTKGKRVLLIGHLDTVFPLNSPFQHFEQHGNTATGPGVIDDKGGDVVIVYALKALQEAHALDNANITIILTGDEEDSGKPTSISRKPLIDAAQPNDIALDFEWSISQDTATIARRGIDSWVMKTEGKEAHSSEIFQKQVGDGALFELVRILNTMRVELSGEPYLSFNPGLTLGGTKIDFDKNKSQGVVFGKGNVVANTAMSQGDLRYLSPKQRIDAKQKIKSIVAKHLPGTTASITFQDGIPSMPPTENNVALLKQYSEVSSDLGYGFVKQLNPGLRGAGDISHIASIVSGALAGLGPVGTGAHSINETLDMGSLPMQTQRAALLIYRIISEPKIQPKQAHNV